MNRENKETIMNWWNRHRHGTEEKKLTLDRLQEDIRKLDGQEFMMTVPIGGDEDGR